MSIIAKVADTTARQKQVRTRQRQMRNQRVHVLTTVSPVSDQDDNRISVLPSFVTSSGRIFPRPVLVGNKVRMNSLMGQYCTSLLKRITGIDTSFSEATLKPLRSLRRTPMCKAVRVYLMSTRPRKTIVTNGGRRIYGLFDVCCSRRFRCSVE